MLEFVTGKTAEGTEVVRIVEDTRPPVERTDLFGALDALTDDLGGMDRQIDATGKITTTKKPAPPVTGPSWSFDAFAPGNTEDEVD